MSFKEIIIQQAVTALLNALPPEVLAEGADRLLDLVENLIEQSETRVDDTIVLPLLRLLRTAFSIPDNDP